MKRQWVSLLLGATLVAGAVGCSSSNSSGGSSGGGTQTVDLAVMDRDYNNDAIYQVMIWLDVLSNSGPGLPAPDMIFDPGTRTPVDGLFHNGDLYVAATNNGGPSGGVLIWRDYLSHAEGDAPDVILDDTSTPVAGPQASQRLAVENNVLASATWYDDAVYIWGSASSLTSGANPDAVLDETSISAGAGNFGNPVDVALQNGRLFVGNYNSTPDATEICVAIWDDVNALVSGGAASADVTLTDDTNFLNLNQQCKHILVANDILYVAGESGPGSFNAPYIFVFNSASTVDNSSLPDNVLVGEANSSSTQSYIESPGKMVVDSNNILWVANKNENNTPNDNAAVAGFFPADALFQNQTPAVMIDKTSGPAQAERVVSVGGALFVTGSPENDDGWVRKGIYVFRTPSNGVAPSLSAMGDDDTTLAFMRFPEGIAAVVRGSFSPDQGT